MLRSIGKQYKILQLNALHNCHQHLFSGGDSNLCLTTAFNYRILLQKPIQLVASQ